MDLDELSPDEVTAAINSALESAGEDDGLSEFVAVAARATLLATDW